MKLLKTQMTPLVKNLLHIEEREQDFLYSPYHGQTTFHAHPEFELVYILEGCGKRIVGNNISTYSSGDMVFMSSNVPHVWFSDPGSCELDWLPKSRAIITYMNPKIFGQMFDLLEEFETIKGMIELASKGFFIYGDTKKIIAQKLKLLINASGYEKIEGFLNILHTIATSNEKKIISDDRMPQITQSSSDKLIPIIQYIKKNLSDTISLEMLANIAFMTVTSFCRFFKARMNISPLQYIVEERLDLARRLLIEVDKPVYEIAGRCGYNSDSHFCKIFKSRYGISPYRYKSTVKGISGLVDL